MSKNILTAEQRKATPNPNGVILTIDNYADVVINRTINNYDDMNYNNFHMVSGLTSELTDELIKALNANDNTNIVEELGDAQFFTIGLLILNGWFDKYLEDIIKSDSMLLDLGFDWSNFEEQAKLSDDIRAKLFNNVLFDTYVMVGKLNTIFKNILIKDTPKYDGKVLTEHEIVLQVINLIVCINTLCHMTGNNLMTVRNVNNEKLFARYSGGTFDPKKSLDRNIEEERKIMDSMVLPGVISEAAIVDTNTDSAVKDDAVIIPLKNK